MLVFVYGTLLSGQPNNFLLDGCKKLGECITDNKYTMLNLGAFPAVVQHGCSAIKGEVWEINESALGSLDTLEGYPSLYKRTRIPTPFGKAWMYYLNLDEHSVIYNIPVIHTGDWRKHYA